MSAVPLLGTCLFLLPYTRIWRAGLALAVPFPTAPTKHEHGLDGRRHSCGACCRAFLAHRYERQISRSRDRRGRAARRFRLALSSPISRCLAGSAPRRRFSTATYITSSSPPLAVNLRTYRAMERVVAVIFSRQYATQ